MRQLLLGTLVLVIAGCDGASEPPTKGPPPAIPLVPPAPAAPPKPPRETVSLHWGGAATPPLALEVEVATDPKHRTASVDMRPLGSTHHMSVQLPSHEAFVTIVGPASSPDQRKVVLLGSPGSRGAPSSKHFAISDTGIIESELDTPTLATVEPILQLPTQPVAVGESWAPLSASGLHLRQEGWVEEKHEKKSRATLTKLEKLPDGHRLAAIEFDGSELLQGHVSTRAGKAVALSMSSGSSGRGEFLVDEGRWQSLEFTLSVTGEGLGHVDIQEHVKVSPHALTPELQRAFESPPPEGKPVRLRQP